MNRHERRAREAQARVGDRQSKKVIADVEAQVRRATPLGHKARRVNPPWDAQHGCVGCGGEAEVIGLFTRTHPFEKVLLYTFGLMCRACEGDGSKQAEISARAFSS